MQRNDKQIERDFTRYKAYGVKLLAKSAIDEQVFDFSAEFDRTLTLGENKTILRDKLKEIGAQQELTKAEIEAQQLRAEHEHKEYLRKEIELYNDSLTAKEQTRSILEIYSELHRNVRMCALGYIHFLGIKSVHGSGKTFQVNNTLLEMGMRKGCDFEVFGGNVTPLELYKIFHEHGSKKVLVFNDVGKLLRNHDSIDLLKEATDFGLADKDGRRIVHNYSSSEKLEGYNKECWVSANLIFTFNSYEPTLDISALFDRGKFLDMVLTREDMVSIMRDICRDEKDKETTEFLIAQYADYGTVNFNLRLQQKAFRVRIYSETQGLDWKAELTDELKKSMLTERQRIFYAFAGYKYVRQIDFCKYFMSVHKTSYRTAERRVKDMLEIEELFTDGKEKQRMLGLLPISH